VSNVLVECVPHEETGSVDSAAFEFPAGGDQDLLGADYRQRLADPLAS